MGAGACMCVCMCVHVHVHARECMHAYVCACACACVCACMLILYVGRGSSGTQILGVDVGCVHVRLHVHTCLLLVGWVCVCTDTHCMHHVWGNLYACIAQCMGLGASCIARYAWDDVHLPGLVQFFVTVHAHVYMWHALHLCIWLAYMPVWYA